MRKLMWPFAAAVFCCTCCVAYAEDPLSKQIVIPDAAAAAAADCKPGEKSCELVCKHLPPPLGTRIGGHTECRTRQWWEDRMREDQARIQKIQHDSFGYGMGVVP